MVNMPKNPYLRRNRKYGRRLAKRNPYAQAKRVGSYKKYTKASKTLNTLFKAIPTSISPFPAAKLVRHRYVENITIPASGVAGNVSFYAFSVANMYDPNFTGTGHQPLFHDEMAASYSFYTVLESTIKVTLDPEDPETMNIGIITTRDSSLPTDPQLLLEQYPHRSPVKPSQLNRPYVIKAKWNAAKWHKSTVKALMGDPDRKTAVGQPPADSPQYYIYRAPVNSATLVGSSVVQVEMTFYTAWRDLNSITGS